MIHGRWSGHRDYRFALRFDLPTLIRGRDRDTNLVPVTGQLFNHLRGTGDLITHPDDRQETCTERSDRRLRYPISENAAHVAHGQHAVRDHIVESGGAREVDIDVDGVVIARRAAINRQDLPGNGTATEGYD